MSYTIFEQVKENFKKMSNTILNDNIEDVKFTDNEKILENKIMKLELDKELSLKKYYTDELGFSFFKTCDFEPKYNYFKSDGNAFGVRLEASGNTICDVNHKIIGDKTIITIKGNKKRDNQPKKPNYNLFNIREFSEFELNIPLKTEEFQINQTRPKNGYPKFKNGICIIQYELAEKGETIKAQTDDD